MPEEMTREQIESNFREWRNEFKEAKQLFDEIREERGEVEKGLKAQIGDFKDGLDKQITERVNEIAEAVTSKFLEDHNEKTEKAERKKSQELAKEHAPEIRKIAGAIGLKSMVFGSGKKHVDTTSDHAMEVIGVPEADRKAIKQFRHDMDACRMFGQMYSVQQRADGIEPLPVLEAAKKCPIYGDTVKMGQYLMRKYPGSVEKAMDTTDSSNWTFTQYSSDLIEDLQSSHDIVGRIRRWQVTGNTLQIPASNRLVGYRIPEATAEAAVFAATTRVVASSYTDRAVTLDPEKVGGSGMMSRELDEDSLFSMQPFVRAGIINQIQRAEEYAFIDGQASVTNTGDHAYANTDPTGVQDTAAKLWNGVRLHAINNTGTPGKQQIATTFSFEDLAAGWAAMGLYGMNTADLGIIVSPKIYAGELVPLTDANNNPVFYGSATYDNAAATGMVPNILGIQIHKSEHVQEIFLADGTTSSTASASIIILVNFQAYAYGLRRETSITPIFEPRTDQIALYGTKRCDIQPLYAPTTNAFTITICGADITG